MVEDRKVLTKLNECIKENKSVAVVMIVDTGGSTPRGVGSLMLVDDKGNLLEGTIGGGILEEKAKSDAAKCIKEKKSVLLNYDLNSKSGNKDVLPMVCGGNAAVFIKVFTHRDRLVIAGAGHVSEKLSKLAKVLGYHITVIDDRRERLTSEIFPNVEDLILGNIPESLKSINIDGSTCVVIVTYGHKYDQDALEAVIKSNACYIGMIGSTNKVKTCFENMIAKGYTKEELSKVYTPIGIDLGGETPEEIALSIMAEIQALKHGKNVPHMKD
ncbi:MAG: XdhC/CoxI family protein [Lutispora sp.]|nr:XdhC/CoxI family protein [Lutispora sp.]